MFGRLSTRSNSNHFKFNLSVFCNRFHHLLAVGPFFNRFHVISTGSRLRGLYPVWRQEIFLNQARLNF
ncbi:hypothetical protein LXL04_039745 [Taraxacum kok-saghyz]